MHSDGADAGTVAGHAQRQPSELLAVGVAFHADVKLMRATLRVLRLTGAAAGGGGKRREAGDSLSERNPW